MLEEPEEPEEEDAEPLEAAPVAAATSVQVLVPVTIVWVVA